MRIIFLALALVATSTARAAPWEFDPAIDVVPAAGKGVFHHLDAGDRKHLATGDGVIAVVWEDNRDGTPRVYAATKSKTGDGFSTARRISGDSAAYDPVILALPRNRFLVGWEEGEAVWVRMLGEQGLGPPSAIVTHAGQVSLAQRDDKNVVAVWSQHDGDQRQIRFATLAIGELVAPVYAGAARAVDAGAATAAQQYPTVAAVGSGLTVAWEDRRRGHTVLYYSHAGDGKKFGEPQALNEVPPKRSPIYGKGTGVMRVSLVRYGSNGVAAVWLDKRELAVGYDVYGAVSNDGGASFGANEKVQDEFGNNIRQWHAALAGNRDGLLAVAWDDDREGTGDIWLSWRGAEGWSDDLAVPGASGTGVQEAPALAIDTAGDLHLIWIDRSDTNAPTRLRYLQGRRRE